MNQFRIRSIQDIEEKLHYFEDSDKIEIANVINRYLNENRVRNPIIRIQNDDLINLAKNNTIGNNLARHLTDIYIIDYPFEYVIIPQNWEHLLKIIMPRLTERGVVILKNYQGIKILRKNVRFTLHSQLYEIAN